MQFSDSFFGNRRQKEFFSSLIAEGKISHAYILEAPWGSGKKNFARLIAASLAFSREPEEERDAKCKRIMEGTSPDVLMLQREEGKRTIGVEAVRDFLASVYLTPSELDFKMFIFDEADRITPQAQNALLKIIEEPPQEVYLILLAENARSLLSTVRSRAQKIALDVFTENELRMYAEQHEMSKTVESEKLDFLLRMAGGSIGRLYALAESGDAEFAAYSTAKKVVEAGRQKGRGMTYFAFLKLITDFCTTREALDMLTRYLLSAYGDLLRKLSGEDLPLYFFSEAEAEELSLFLTAKTLTDSLEKTDDIRRDMQYNTSLSLSAAALAMALWKAV